MSNKIPLSQIEANWYAHVAGMKAEKEARERGSDEAANESLLDAACGGKVIGGLKFPPIHAGFLMMMAKAQGIAERNPEMASEMMGSDMGHLGALALILHSPELAWQMMRQPDAETLFAEAVTEFAMQFKLSDLREIVLWITEDMAKMQKGGDAAGKPAAE